MINRRQTSSLYFDDNTIKKIAFVQCNQGKFINWKENIEHKKQKNTDNTIIESDKKNEALTPNFIQKLTNSTQPT